MIRQTMYPLVAFGLVALLGQMPLPASAEQGPDLAAQLRNLDAAVFPPDTDRDLTKMLSIDARARIRAANQRETAAWRELKNKADWERYTQPRLAALKASLGQPFEAPKDLKLRVTRTIEGDGYKIENVVFESRPGVIVTANLYSPKVPGKSMPGFVICPSHHNPKTQGELQDMGMSWARHGSVVIVLDSLGHGERRAHPFVDAKSYPGTFKVSRQDYYFRYNTAMQLHLVGESLVGWMANDLSRCADVLLSRPGIDKNRIALLGSVAGGGDPAAVAAALDPRFTCLVPFNFGGPQPETIFPLPTAADAAFNYAGGGSWESTRNLWLSTRDGFLPWMIVGSVAPRYLNHAHEFAWDKDRDPVWKRYQQIYSWYGVPDNLAVAHGRGSVTGKPPEATHCNNIGPEHRKELYPSLNRWFKLDESAEKEYRTRHNAEELMCLTKEAVEAVKPRQLYEVAGALGAERVAAARAELLKLTPEARLQKLRQEWAKLLGDIEPKAAPKVVLAAKAYKVGDVTVSKELLEVDRDIVVPMVLLSPPRKGEQKQPVVVAFAQEGKQAFLKQRADGIAELLQAGVAVCLPDLRGTGESAPKGSRGRQSEATSISATEYMNGRTLLGLRLRDLRSVLANLRTRPELDAKKVALWGDSFAPPNSADVRIDVPWDAEKLPGQSEPLGGLLALYGALYEPDVRAIYGQGGLAGWMFVVQSPFCYVPHDAIVPGAALVSGLSDVTGALAPRPVRLEGLVDGTNRLVTGEKLAKAFAPTQAAYAAAKAANRLTVGDGKEKPSAWLVAQLKAK